MKLALFEYELSCGFDWTDQEQEAIALRGKPRWKAVAAMTLSGKSGTACLGIFAKASTTSDVKSNRPNPVSKVIKSQQIFPSDEAAFKLVYLAMRNISLISLDAWAISTNHLNPYFSNFLNSQTWLSTYSKLITRSNVPMQTFHTWQMKH